MPPAPGGYGRRYPDDRYPDDRYGAPDDRYGPLDDRYGGRAARSPPRSRCVAGWLAVTRLSAAIRSTAQRGVQVHRRLHVGDRGRCMALCPLHSMACSCVVSCQDEEV
jgi:hypothetical protein